MIKTIYNTITGQIVSTTNRSIGLDLPDNHAIVDGNFNANLQYIDAEGKPQDLPQPPQDNNKYKFDWTTKTYTPVVDPVTADTERAKRDAALISTVDRVSATRYDSLTTEQQQELQTYRQALLDVPQQTGFPDTIEWPEKPTWL